MTIHNLSRAYEISGKALHKAVCLLNGIQIEVPEGLDKLTVAFQKVSTGQNDEEQHITITDLEGKLLVRFNRTAYGKEVRIQFADESEILSEDSCILHYPDGSSKEDVFLSHQIRNVFYLLREAQL